MTTQTFLVVVDERLYVGTGLVHRWMLRVGNNLYHTTVAFAPIRSGMLKSMIDLDFPTDANLRVVQAVVSSNAPHTRYVLGGTANNGAGFIYSTVGYANRAAIAAMARGKFVSGKETAGWWMVIRDGGPKWHLRVHGQKANNFMIAAYNATSRTHRALHPIHPGLIGF